MTTKHNCREIKSLQIKKIGAMDNTVVLISPFSGQLYVADKQGLIGNGSDCENSRLRSVRFGMREKIPTFECEASRQIWY